MTSPYRVWEDVYALGGPDISDPYDCCVYLAGRPEQPVMIDCGAGRSFEQLVTNMHSLGFDPQRLGCLLVTHAHIDHIGALAEFRERFKVKVIAHEMDAGAIESGRGVGAEMYGVPYTPCPVDVRINAPEYDIPCGPHHLRAVHIPGHTRGSLAAFVDIEGKRVLFGQDIHGPYVARWGADMNNVGPSLRKLIDLHADILCEGHSGIYQPAPEVEKYIRGYLRDHRT